MGQLDLTKIGEVKQNEIIIGQEKSVDKKLRTCPYVEIRTDNHGKSAQNERISLGQIKDTTPQSILP